MSMPQADGSPDVQAIASLKVRSAVRSRSGIPFGFVLERATPPRDSAAPCVFCLASGDACSVVASGGACVLFGLGRRAGRSPARNRGRRAGSLLRAGRETTKGFRPKCNRAAPLFVFVPLRGRRRRRTTPTHPTHHNIRHYHSAIVGEACGLTQVEVATSLGVSQSCVSRLAPSLSRRAHSAVAPRRRRRRDGSYASPSVARRGQRAPPSSSFSPTTAAAAASTPRLPFVVAQWRR